MPCQKQHSVRRRFESATERKYEEETGEDRRDEKRNKA
jgi:hypothetical protein